ncbi:MAG: purine-nucleoside phosphorylase [Ndongobacter sp.]|nr:purine-nucleoside phosphorylase [Ndongobacter sp.]
MRDYSFRSAQTLQRAADYIAERISIRPKLGLVLGSALGSLIDDMEDPVVIDYAEIPGFLISTVASHEGKMYIGSLYGVDVLCLKGRFHYYEGYDFEQIPIPFRVMKLLGVEGVILTNAAGAVNYSYKVGDIMIMDDYIKLMGASPLRGANDEAFGPRFFDVKDVFAASWRAVALSVARQEAVPVQQGVYFFMPGPQFESPAEIRAIRMLGGDAVGMSTVPDAISAHQCGIKVLGLSLMTNLAAGMTGLSVDTDEVDVAGQEASTYFKAYLKALLPRL